MRTSSSERKLYFLHIISRQEIGIVVRRSPRDKTRALLFLPVRVSRATPRTVFKGISRNYMRMIGVNVQLKQLRYTPWQSYFNNSLSPVNDNESPFIEPLAF